MVIDKTGGLFRLAIRMMAAFSAEQPARDYVPLVNELALYFQIRDDLMNLTASGALHKSFAEDLTEGKYSFPVIHCILANPQDHRLVNILKQRTEDVDVKRYAVAYLRQAGSFDYTRGVLNGIKQSLETRIQALGGNAQLMQIIRVLANTIDEPAESPVSSRPPVPLKLSHEEQP
jgi:geranylgeranyl diphosphate synthase type 3